jgi:DNA-binding GntR family transcriptional regulator
LADPIELNRANNRKRMISQAELAGLHAQGARDAPRRGKRGMLHAELVARLRDMIVEGEIAPGAKLSEPTLCAHFNVSRTPLREAFKALAADGLIVLRPRRGAVVAQLNSKEVEEMFAVMGALEALSGELAAKHVTDREATIIGELHALMLRFYAQGDRHAYFALNQEIHERILAAARNTTLSAIYGSLAGRVRRARYLANLSHQRWSEAVAEHEAILAALTARDGARLGALLRAHLANKGKAVADVLRAEQRKGGEFEVTGKSSS